MFWVFCACLLGGVVLLILDVRGRLVASPGRVRWSQRLGVAAAGAAGLAPALGWATGGLLVTWPFPVFALAYALAFATFAGGVFGLGGAAHATILGRGGYLGLLLLNAVPSTLLILAPLLLVAGFALARTARFEATTANDIRAR